MHLQDFIHRITEGAGDRVIRLLTLLLCFVALTMFYDLRGYKTLGSQEAMDTAQLARNLALGRGYTTRSIRPLLVTLMQRQGPKGTSPLNQPLPDVSNAPVYPALLALVFKVGAFHCGSGHSVSPMDLEPWIMGFNQFLFFIAAVLLFKTASQWFDRSVAWLATGVFVGTDLMWQFSVSGLPTMLLLVIFLLVVRGIAWLDGRVNVPIQEQRGSVGVCLILGSLIAVGGLTLYSFAWLILTVLLFILLTGSPSRFKLCAAVSIAFLAVMTPWLVRNYQLSGNLFGTAGYSIFQSTPVFQGDALERNFEPQHGLSRIYSGDFADKLLANTRDILSDDLPKLGGNWLSAFFLVGLLVPFRKPLLSKMRYFTLGSAILLVGIQALGRTHLTDDSPVLNSENLLILFAPVMFMFGTALFFTLLEQLDTQSPAIRNVWVGLFATVMCAPFILMFLTAPAPFTEAFDPYYIQRVVNWTREEDLMTSDVPSAVAWYGDQPCAWLPLNSGDGFNTLNRLKPVEALYLTQRTTRNCMSQASKSPTSWERMALDCWAHGTEPDNIPMTNAPTGLLPERVFLSRSDVWQSSKN